MKVRQVNTQLLRLNALLQLKHFSTYPPETRFFPRYGVTQPPCGDGDAMIERGVAENMYLEYSFVQN